MKDVPSIPAKSEVNKKEMEIATTLIDQLTAKFEPNKYHDEYRIALQQLIDTKIKEEKDTTEENDHNGNIGDLMKQLQSSIQQNEKTAKKSAKKKSTAKKSS